VERRCPGFEIACARNAEERGSQIALRNPQGYAIMRALIDRRVIGDFRAPDVLRFGLAPLYTRYVDVWDAVDRLCEVMSEGVWRDERYRIQATVT
jgi:kynureninase